MSRIEKKDWISAHIYFKGNIYSYEADRIIIEVVDPFIRKCIVEKVIDGYFFIRYSELGSHIRLRLSSSVNDLSGDIRSSLVKHVTEKFPKDLSMAPLLKKNNIQENWRSGIENLLWIPYEAEVRRYGGPYGIEVAEELFKYSSEIAIELLRQIPKGEKSIRLGKCLITMLLILFVFCEHLETAARYAQQYSQNYLRSFAEIEKVEFSWVDIFDNAYKRQAGILSAYVEATWSALEANDNISPIFDNYYNYLVSVKRKMEINIQDNKLVHDNSRELEQKAIMQMILSSYIHMMNNRMGISIMDECYLAHLISQSLICKYELSVPKSMEKA